jgi:CDP-Glycerol:Poly(glycerophosphate) glycerophosphotransferase
VYDGTITKNLLRTSVFDILKADPRLHITLIPPTGKYDAYKEEFALPGKVDIVSVPAWRSDWKEFIFTGLFRHSIPTRFMQIRQVDWYWNKGKYAHYVFVSLLRTLGHFRAWQHFLMWFNNFEVIPSYIRTIYAQVQPDILLAPTMMPRDEVTLMRLMRADKKPIIGMAKSFDNLTSKAYLRIHPDTLIVPNEIGIEEAVSLYEYPRVRVVPTGIPQYDRYFGFTPSLSRAQFIESIGGDPLKKLIMYAPAGDWMNDTDHQTLGKILSWIDNGTLSNVQVLLRLHPAYTSKTESLAGHPSLLVERPGQRNGELKNYEFKKGDVEHLAHTLCYSDMVICTASTMMIEAPIFDTPVIALAFDGDEQRSYWQSVARYYDREHCIDIVQASGMRIPRSYRSLLKDIQDYLHNPALDAEGRKKIVEKVVWATDGKSAERIAEAVLDFV